MAYSMLSIPEKLAFIDTALKNALANPIILGRLEEYGYGATRIHQGQTILKRAQEITSTQGGEFGDQLNLTAAKEEARLAANETYLRNLKLTRSVVTKPGDRKKMELDGDRETGFEGWSRQTSAYYKFALADESIVQLLTAEFNLTREKLLTGQALYQTALDKSQQQTAQKGVKQNSTQERDQIMAEVDVWMSKYQVAAEVALEDQPQLLESLGWFVRNAPRQTSPDSVPVDPAPGPIVP